MGNLGAAGRHHLIGRTAAVLALAGLTAACSSATATSNRAPGLEKSSIVVGAVPAADSAGLYIAQQRGYFAAEGLHVKIVPIVSAELAISGQLAGTYDVTLGNYVSYIEADAEQHAGLRIIAEGSVMQPGNQAIVTLPRSRIATLAGLRGATLAVNVKNNVGTILIGSALEEHGLSLSDVKLVPIQFPFMAAALKDHQVDAAWMPEPFLSSAEEQLGALGIFDLDQGSAQSFPVVGYAVTRSWEQKYPKTAAAFLGALEKGQAMAEADRTAVERSIQAFLGMPARTASIVALPAFPLGVDRVRLQRVSNAMHSFGLLKQPFNVGQMTG